MQPTCDLPGNGDIFSKQVVWRLDRSSCNNLVPSRFSSSWSHLLPETVTLARPILCILFAVFILCSAASSLPSARPETGTYIKDMDRDGYGLLTIHNNWTMDTVAVLTDKKVKPLLAAYLRSKDTLKITGIKDGEYGLYFTVGNLWDAKAGKFSGVYGYYRYNAPLDFETDDVGSEIEYSVFELDLYEAGHSNFVPDQFQFPDLKS
jgi:hypothetical protein